MKLKAEESSKEERLSLKRDRLVRNISRRVKRFWDAYIGDAILKKLHKNLYDLVKRINRWNEGSTEDLMESARFLRKDLLKLMEEENPDKLLLPAFDLLVVKRILDVRLMRGEKCQTKTKKKV